MEVIFKHVENKEDYTDGLKAVQYDFNPSGNQNISNVKLVFGKFIDLVLDNYKAKEEERRLTYIENVIKTAAVNALITCQMAVVKAIAFIM